MSSLTGRGPGRPVFLTGMMGSGKSTVAPLLAAAWGVPWLDLDERIERLFGESVPTLVSRGEPTFRRCEREALRLLVEEPGFAGRTVVIATGGGVVLDPVNRERMRRVGVLVFLRVPVAELARRLLRGPLASRPLLGDQAEGVAARLAELLERRKSAYEEATWVVDGDGAPQDVAHRICEQQL